MDLKSKTIYVGRVEDAEFDQETEKEDLTSDDKQILSPDAKEHVTLIGTVEDTEHFEEEPKLPSGSLHFLLDAYSKKKTNIFEVNTRIVF